jgi:ppGpp synthetase/RelA/SpoT-type nucleotidyltranferase
MKVVESIRLFYNDWSPKFNDLSAEIESMLESTIRKNGWLYIGRVKKLESLALKIETGRFSDNLHVEDFFACTIVVATFPQIEEAEKDIRSHFTVVERRPENANKTRNRASDFVFDDLRLYCIYKVPEAKRDKVLDGLKFEVQIKTVLQHAWAQATHDLTYKSETTSWSRDRIAFQVKAMLEHAEIAISEASRLASAPAVAKDDEKTSDIRLIIDKIKEIWDQDKLPSNLKLLAENIFAILKICDIKTNLFKRIIDTEICRLSLKKAPENLSPYAFTVQALAYSAEANLESKLKTSRKIISVHKDMELPTWMKERNKNIVIIDYKIN